MFSGNSQVVSTPSASNGMSVRKCVTVSSASDSAALAPACTRADQHQRRSSLCLRWCGRADVSCLAPHIARAGDRSNAARGPRKRVQALIDGGTPIIAPHVAGARVGRVSVPML
jgi:hypothetical protein